jgi:hypothetical protein
MDYTDVNPSTLSRWKTHQQQLQQFWRKWSADYLQGLQQRSHWHHFSHNFQPGDLVLMKEGSTTPLQWPIAVVTYVHPGDDGIVRVVTLHTAHGLFKRPITKICIIPRVTSD